MRPVLMCSPVFAARLAGEQSWLPTEPPLDRGLAVDQWERLASLISEHVGPVERLQPEPWAPAMTFTRDLGLAVDNQLVLLVPSSRRGPFEAPLVHRRLATSASNASLPERRIRLDGGNVLADSHGRLLIGVTSPEPTDELVGAVRALERATARDAYRVPLSGGRFPHLDMALCDLAGRAWLAYPKALPGFDPRDAEWRDLLADRPVIEVDDRDGELLACNLVLAGRTAIGPQISSALQRQIEARGINYVATPLGELRKAGGGARCLTLELPGRHPDSEESIGLCGV